MKLIFVQLIDISKDSASQVHVTFAIVDEGVLKTGQEAAATMNKVSNTVMSEILDAKQVIKQTELCLFSFLYRHIRLKKP